jgi:hypothetical protein
MPLWLLVSLEAPKTTIAIFPLCSYIFGFLATLASERLTSRFGSTLFTMIGCGFILSSSAIVMMCCEYGWYTYLVAVFLGCGSGIVSVSALSLICELVGENCESSAFVFGAMSFTDKAVSTGNCESHQLQLLTLSLSATT